MGWCCKVVIQSWDDFYALAKGFLGREWIFRGQERASWRLDSSLERECYDYVNANFPADFSPEKKLKNSISIYNYVKKNYREIYGGTEYADECSATRDFARYAKRNFPYDESDLIQYLAIMQHYGAHTRLVDFSHSLFVALYFATERTMVDENRAVWAIRMDPIVDFAENELKKLLNVDASDHNFHLIANEILRTNGDVLPSGARGVLPIRLPGNNVRMDAQNGIFLFPVEHCGFVTNLAASLDVDEQDILTPEEVEWAKVFKNNNCPHLVKMECTSELMTDVRDVLKHANVTARALFPGLEGVARGVRYNLKK